MSETTVTESETTVSDVDESDEGRTITPGQSPGSGLTGWFAASMLRMGLAVVGFLLLLAALGQLSGLDLIGMGAEAINTDVGRWVIVAVVAVGLIVAAVYGFGGIRSE